MATTRPFAYNTGSTIDGTIQIGNIAIGVSDQDYSQNPGGVKWWMGPDEELGYVIANQVPTGDHPTPTDEDSYINFWRSTDLTEQSLLDLLNVLPITDGLEPFTNGSDAKTWLNANGYFTSYGEDLPTPTPTPTNLPTATPTPTPSSTPLAATSTPTPTPLAATSTPTPTETPIPTDTPTPTPDATNVPTDTPTPEPTSGPTATPTSTPEGAVLTIIVPEGTPGIIFDGETYTSSVSAGVVKNQQYFINVTEPSSNFSRWSGTGVNLPAATSKFTVVYVTGNTATLEVLLTLPTATPTPTSAPTSTPLPATATPTPLPATATPTPTTTSTPTPTITIGPLNFTIEYDCVGGGRIKTSNHSGGSGVIDRGTGVFNTEQEALAETSWLQLANPAQSVISFITPLNSIGTRWVSIRDRNNPTDVFAKSITFDCASTPTPTPLPATSTPTPLPATSTPIPATDTPTPTPEPTSSPTDTPTPTPTSGSCSGIRYNLTDTWGSPTSGNTLWVYNGLPVGASNEVNRLGVANPTFIHRYDSDGIDRLSYFSNFTGNSFTMTVCQDGNTAIYSGTSGTMTYNESGFFNINGNSLSLVQSSPVTAFTFNQSVYYNFTDPGQSTPTPTPTVASTNIPTDTPTPTPEATSTPEPATATPAPTGVPTDTPTPTPLAATSTPTPTPTSAGAGWNFYLTSNTVVNIPPQSNGQILFYTSASGAPRSTYNPNAGSANYIMIYIADSAGTSYETQFQNLQDNGGTINITQNGNTATYVANGGGQVTIDPAGFLLMSTSLQTATVVSPFTFTDRITITFGDGSTPTPTPTVVPSTSTPTPLPATSTPSPTDTPTPTPTSTSVPATSTPTPTPTSEPTTGLLTIYESGSNVVMSVSGTIDLSGLTLIQAGGQFGGDAGGIGPNTATFIMASNNSRFDTYSGFTITPNSFGSGNGASASSSTGGAFGVIFNNEPPYQLVVPSGYTSGTQITSIQTFTGQTLTTLGLTVGTYTYTWSGGSFDVVVGGTPGPTPTPTPTSVGGGAGWLFYSPDNQSVMAPPTSNGNATFIAGPNGVYSPNYTGGTLQIYFNLNDSTGTSYSTQFNSLDTTGGTLTISQGSSVAIYSGTSTDYSINSGFFLLNVTRSAQMIQSGSTRFVSGSTINLNFGGGSGTPTPTPTPGGPTATPTPTTAPTSTPTPTSAPTSTPTPLPATATPTPSATATETPTPEPPTATPTATPIPSNIIVAAGGVNALGYSYDGGDNWTNSTNGGTFFTQPALTVATDGNMFVAGGTRSSNSLAYSYDGDNWTGATNGSTMFTTNVRGVSYGGGRWVAVGISSGAAKFAYSNDGITWTAASNSNAIGSVPNSVAYNGSRWVAVGSSPAGGSGNRTTIAYSDDGISWTASANSGTIFTGSSLNVAWGGDKWVAVGTGANRIAYSTDGITWSGSTSGNNVITGTGYGIAYNGSQWVAAGQGTNALAYSSDGITWSGATNGNTIFTFQSYCVTWAGTKWVAGGLGTNQLATSTDGITWTVTTNGNTIMNNRVQGLAAKY